MAVITSNSITFIDNTGLEKYLYIRYSNDGVTFTENNGLTPGEWLGACTTNSSIAPVEFSAYQWSKIKGEDGASATPYYTWIKYADDSNGTNMSDDPTDKSYIGFAYNKESSQESEIASDYIWSLIKGSNGIDGDDGVTYYTWVKYADDEYGNGLSDDPTGKEYIGISYNNLTDEESNNPNDYTWSLFKGRDGLDGKNGVAGKGIKSITEYYLTSEHNTGIDRSHKDWSTNIPTLDSVKKYLWNYEKTIFVIEELDATGNIIKREEVDDSEPIIIGVYGETGSSLQIKYISSVTTPIINNNDVSAWLDIMPTPIDDQKIYMVQKLSTDINWSSPIQISATDGTTPNIIIVDGYWYINGESTGIKAEGADGEDGDTPSVTIGANGNWFINGVDSGTKAQGEAGKDGADIEYVYYRSKTETALSTPSYTNGVLTSGWTSSPQGITETYKYEYVSVRNKPSGGSWSAFSHPVIWSKWGEKGQDGDGVEYKYYLSNSSSIPTYSASDNRWTDDPTGVSADNQYEYVVQIKISTGTQNISIPSLWAKYGEDGNGITSITNYYNVTSAPTAPSNWETFPPAMTSTNKYLWNYEEIAYTNGTIKTTNPAIIGIRGDNGTNGTDGTDSVDFQIYSVNGFEFNDNLTSIELKTAAFKGGKIIESGITYQWKWYNKESTLDDKYEYIVDATLPTLIVDMSQSYAFASLKCEMTYDGIIYEDYISLTQQSSIYTALAKFFNGSNIITVDDDYLIVYVELYKDNVQEEFLYSDKVYISDNNTLNGNIIITDLSGNYKNGSMMYFNCKIEVDNKIEYNVILGQYDESSDQWNVIASDYIYRNDLFANTTSPIVYVPKDKISKSLSINFEVYKNDAIVARTNTIVLDLNDPLISSNPPVNPKEGQLWLDTSISPSILKMWDGTQWVNSGYQNGGAIYTSQPTQYTAGDLWILADDEICGEYGPGTMLKAIESSISFNEAHWTDTMAGNTEILNNVKQYFLFNQETGLRIGQRDEKFYVNINSTEMGFYDNSDSSNPDQKVVSIGNKSAKIKNIIVEDSAEFNCATTFNKQINIHGTDSNNTTINFVWKIESNGSLSLAIG